MNQELNTIQNADQIAYEINFIKQQTLETVLAASIQIGERLCNAKELVPHGQWGDWLKEKVDYSQSTAENLMRIYKEYGDEQIFLSGRSKSQTFANLTYSQAVALFALPEPAREEIVAENNVSDMTTKELKEAIAEKKAAIKAQKAAEQEAETLKTKLNKAQSDADKQELESKKLKEEKNTLTLEKGKLKTELEAANKRMQELTSQAVELSEEEKEKVRKEIAEKYEDKLQQLTLDAETAKQQAERIASEKAAAERKAAQLANTDLIKIQTIFEQVQGQLKDIHALIAKLPQDKIESMTNLIINTAAQILKAGD